MRELSVGYLDAYEDEAFLRTCFIETENYRRALQPDTNYICGRRGSGKSAMVMRFQESGKYRHYKKVDGAEFYEQLLILLRHNPIPGLTSKHLFRTIWKHLIIVAAMNSTIGPYKDPDELSDTLTGINDYLTLTETKRKGPAALWEKTLHAVLSVSRSEKAKSDPANMVLSFVNNLINEQVFREAEARLKSYLSRSSNRSLVVVDAIIDKFERDEFFLDCVTGLLEAVLELTCQKYAPFLEVKCCIPGEVYPHLKLYEISKVEDHLVRLDWRPKDLVRMISKRLFYYLVISGTETQSNFDRVDWANYDDVVQRAWRRYFPPHLLNNRSVEEFSLTYILRHTQLTPRELIRIANAFIRELECDSPSGLDEAIRKSVHDSITRTVQELLVSNSFYLPNLDRVLDLSFGGVERVMSVQTARKLVAKSKSFWKTTSAEPVIEDSIIDYLLQVGFLGVVVSSPSSDDRFLKCKFAYMVPERVSLDKDRLLAIHPMFYERFHISNACDKLVYPVRHMDEPINKL
jgi:hypothetical protein